MDTPYCAECILQRAELSELGPAGTVRITGGQGDPILPTLQLAVTVYQGTAYCARHVIQAARAR